MKMIPKIFEYEDKRIKVTAEAFMIPELHEIIKKHDLKAEPYLAYCHLMTAPTSPYANEPDDEKQDKVIFDVIQTVGDFDIEDELLQPAVEKLEGLYTSTTKRYYDALKISIDKMAKYLKDTPITQGKEGNLGEIMRIQKEGALTIRNFKDIEKQVDEELKTKMRGKNDLGDY